MTSNAFTYTGNVPYYLMNDVTLEKLFSARWANFSVKAAVKTSSTKSMFPCWDAPCRG